MKPLMLIGLLALTGCSLFEPEPAPEPPEQGSLCSWGVRRQASSVLVPNRALFAWLVELG